VKGLVGFCPCLDIQDVPPGRPDVLGPERRVRFSPARAVHAGSPPLLVARAGLDQPGLNRTIDLFVEAALRANAPLELVNHPQGRHGFDILDPVPRTIEILERTLAFLSSHLL
jgi:hypothetical protein